MKALSFNSQDLERELKNVVSIKRCGSLKIVCRFSTLWEPKTMSKPFSCTTSISNFWFEYPDMFAEGKNDSPAIQ